MKKQGGGKYRRKREANLIKRVFNSDKEWEILRPLLPEPKQVFLAIFSYNTILFNELNTLIENNSYITPYNLINKFTKSKNRKMYLF